MGMYGADVAQLKSLAKTFSASAERLDSSAAVVSSAIKISAWVGPFAVNFRLTWQNAHSRKMHSAAQLLRDSAQSLLANVHAQEEASAASGGATSSSISSAHGTVQPTKSFMTKLRVMNKTEFDSDGIRIEQVIGPDNKVRFVVYIAGTFGGDGLGAFNNAQEFLSAGSPTLRRMEAAIQAATKSNPDAEVMVVGFSQGGIIAQELADRHKTNITQVLTYGAPALDSYNNYGGADVVRLRNSFDVVPTTEVLYDQESLRKLHDLRSLVDRETAQRGDVRDFTGSSNAPGANITTLFAHAVPENYDAIAEQFDDDQAEWAVEARANFARFRGMTMYDSDKPDLGVQF